MDTLYILDDSKEFTDTIEDVIEYKKIPVKYKIFNDPVAFKKMISERIFAVVVDFFMPKIDGLDILRSVKEVQPDALIVLTSVSEYTQLPLPVFREKYITFVSKSEDNYVDIIVELANKHFDKMATLKKLEQRIMQ